MTRNDHLMTIVMEECAEVAQRVSKAMRFGMEQIQQDANDRPEENPDRLTNRERIIEEYNHLAAAMEMIGIGMDCIDDQKLIAKGRRVEAYLERSRREDRLTD